jgi:hypothetical protein
MNDDATRDELLSFFKALIDPDRLAIAGRLVQASATIEALAATTGLARIDVQRQLDRLIDAGLATVDGGVYALDRDALHARARRVLSSDAPAVPPADYLEKVLADYLRPDGSLKDIPVQLKKRQIIYAHIAARFEPDRRYTEKEVNQLLQRFHADFASIRRDLFDLGFIDRSADGRDYWRRLASSPPNSVGGGAG